MNRIKKLIVTILSVVGFITIVVISTSLYMVHKFVTSGGGKEPIRSNSVLVVKLGDKPLSEGGTNLGLDFLVSGRHKSLPEIIRVIHQARDDSRIKGLVIKAEGSNFSMAQVQELREAIKSFKESQKRVYAYSDTMGEGGNGTAVYYLSTSAHDIWLQPRGSVNLTGMMLESYFLKGLLDEYNVKTQLDRREAYKGIIETYTHKEFSPETKENLKNLLDDLMDQMTTDVAQDRQWNKEKFKDMVDNGPYDDWRAHELKLVDHLGHYDEFQNEIKKQMGADVTFVSDRSYVSELQETKGEKKIALIYVDGTIFGNINPMGEEDAMSPRNVAKLLHKACEDSSIHGVILRINSPGGTVTGAETIWYEVRKIREAKKPIIVSMGATAASAGYQIAAPATKIVANPATLTGSIGVASGKMALNGAFEHFHVHWDRIKSGANAGMWSMTEEFSPQGWQKLQESLNYFYDDFLSKVAEGRKMNKEEVRKIAQGQVWSGRQAQGHKLVDELGGLTKAIDVTKKELGLKPEDSVQVVTLMAKSPLFDGWFELVNAQLTRLIWGQVREYVPLGPVSMKALPLTVKN